MQEKMKAWLRESSLVAHSGREREFTQPSFCLSLHICSLITQDPVGLRGKLFLVLLNQRTDDVPVRVRQLCASVELLCARREPLAEILGCSRQSDVDAKVASVAEAAGGAFQVVHPTEPFGGVQTAKE